MKDEIDKRWHDLGEFIREQRNVGQMSLRKLSELAGVSNPYLSQIERGLRKPSAEILQQILNGVRKASPQGLAAFQRWQDAAWRRQTLYLR